MARRKGVSRAEQHDWQPGAADMVQCSKCSHLTSADQARRGIGPCPGKPDSDKPDVVRYFKDDIEITREEAIEPGKGPVAGLRTGVTALYDRPPTGKPPLIIPVTNGVKIEWPADSAEKLVPDGAQPIYEEEHLVGYIIPGSTSVTFLEGQQPPVIAGGGPREVASICDTCGRTRPGCGNDPSTVQRAMNDDILECSDWRQQDDPTLPPEPPPESLPVVIPQPGPNYIEPEEHCNACHGPLAIIPINTKMSMVACPNRGCDLWRERLRWYPRQDRNPRRRRASRANNGLSGS